MGKRINKYLIIGGILLMALLAAWMVWPGKPLPRATWVWEAAEIEQRGTELVNELQADQFGMLYLQVNPNVKEEHYRTFLKAARTAGIEVHALDGAPEWALAGGQAESEATMKWLEAYQAGALPEERFQGVHIDVEPYTLPEWKQNKQKLIENYQQIIKEWSEFAKRQEIVIGVDIPFWYDEERIGQMSLFAWISEAVDTVTLMSYRNFIEGENGVLDITQSEREMSKKAGKPLYLALETEPSQEGAHLFFDSYTALMQAVEQLGSRLEDQQGIAIHHFQRYRHLQK